MLMRIQTALRSSMLFKKKQTCFMPCFVFPPARPEGAVPLVYIGNKILVELELRLDQRL
jgi:hypothetical protein